jgi:hypothetical protein
MNTRYYQILDMLSWNPIVYLELNEWGAFRKLVYIILMQLTSGDWQNRAALRQGFLHHNALVRSLAPKEIFLDFQAKEGWGTLCRVLERPEPVTPFPAINSGNETAILTQKAYRATLLGKAKQRLPVIMAVLVVTVGWLHGECDERLRW